MCGIVGAFDLSHRREPDSALLRRMNAAQIHRGPDEGTELLEPGIALGCRRLAIIDVPFGHQPALNESGEVAVVFNGEIYNFLELRRELEAKGHRFRTHSDTEVLAHGWEEWGETCVERLNGMFAFAIWDRRRRMLFLARDRIGEKPLHYLTTPDGWLYFASELKALMLLPGFDRSLDPLAIEDYFAFGYVPDPRTIFRAARKLPPAHTLLLRAGGSPQIRGYWDVPGGEPLSGTEVSLADELFVRLSEAVRMRLAAEVPLGAFLSGGIDSSAVVAVMASTANRPIQTCSIAFADRRFDESRYAKLAVDQLRTDHAIETVDPDPAILAALPRIHDEPFADSSALPTYALSRLAKRRVTVALSGDGGDELFAGYRRYKFHLREERLRRAMPLSLRRPVFGAAARLYPKLDWAPQPLRAKSTLAALAADTVDAYAESVSIMPEHRRGALYSPELRRALDGYRAADLLREHAMRGGARDPLSLAQYLDLKTYLPGDILVKVDRAGMAHSLEVRMPFLDHTLVEWVARLPAALKMRGGRAKHILKQSLEGRIPQEILDRPKMGFAVPLAGWLRGPFRSDLEAAIAGPALAGSGWFDPAALGRLASEHRSGLSDHSAALWALLMFDGFLRALAER
ncbi:MAG: amidotransferase 1, exosortase A system-associated [Rhodospirillales bacterium]|nr:amidotransferase 1, exosortase A system-associated [Rhodospirillales bacterium]